MKLHNLFGLCLAVIVLVQIDCAGSCSHPIFCNQTILTAVANSDLFKDSKTFVDLVLKVPIEEALQAFAQKPLAEFIEKCFDDPSAILEACELTDWKPNPAFLSAINNKELRDFGKQLNLRWKQLARKVNLNYKGGCQSNCSSFLPEMNGRKIIVPGGRFREAYYWDTYWIIKGLIVCDLLDTAEEVIENFIIMIESYGMIPNGFRMYFLNRSQPPFFFMMVKQVAAALIKSGLSSRAQRLQERAFHSLMQEHQFFMKTHAKPYQLSDTEQIVLNFYTANTKSPRPESYREDMLLTINMTGEEKDRVLQGISSMAESGWDFSSRWLKDPRDLSSTIIGQMFPSDLNTLMGLMEEYLVEQCEKNHRPDLASQYSSLLVNRKKYFAKIFDGTCFPDSTGSSQTADRTSIYPSDFYPFLLFPLKTAQTKFYQDKVNPVTSSLNNQQQWDQPNVWAPNNWILHEVSNPDQSFRFAQEWVLTTYCSWKKEGFIYEKYRNDAIGERGQGGEYGVQTGFGWSNGLALYYLNKYGDRLQPPKC